MKHETFTPAPWSVYVHGEEFESIGVRDKYGQDICECFNATPWPKKEKPGIDGDEQEANAHLIAKAPMLYKHLREAAYEFCHNCLSLRIDREEDIPSSEELIERNCPLQDNGCFCRKWWDTLKEAGVEE